MRKILVLEDDRQLLRLMESLLSGEGFFVTKVSSIERAKEFLKKNYYDLLILDRILEDGDSLELVKDIRNKDVCIRILILSKKRLVEDRVKALKLADDFLAKPFTGLEFILKVKNLLKRSKRMSSRNLKLSDGVYISNGLISYKDKLVSKDNILRKKEMLILNCLIKHKNSLVSYETLISYVWGFKDNPPGKKTINVYIRRIRMKLGPLAKNLETIRGRGYRFVLS